MEGQIRTKWYFFKQVKLEGQPKVRSSKNHQQHIKYLHQYQLYHVSFKVFFCRCRSGIVSDMLSDIIYFREQHQLSSTMVGQRARAYLILWSAGIAQIVCKLQGYNIAPIQRYIFWNHINHLFHTLLKLDIMQSHTVDQNLRPSKIPLI